MKPWDFSQDVAIIDDDGKSTGSGLGYLDFSYGNGGSGQTQPLKWQWEVKNPAAELRGIKIQNSIAPVADTLYSDV